MKEDNEIKDNRSLYDISIGRKEKSDKTEEVELDEALKEQEKQLHQQWLEHPTTTEYLNDTKFTLGKILDRAMDAASIGNNEAALRLLIKAKAFKEVIDYATRRNTQ